MNPLPDSHIQHHRAIRGLFAAAFFVACAAQGADAFYLLTRSGSAGNYRYAVKCLAPNGVLLKQLDLAESWNQSSDCSAIASDGAVVWIAHAYDRNRINGLPFWGTTGGGSVSYQTSEAPTYGYGKGLALQGGILYLVRDHLDPGTDRIEKYSASTGAYLGQWKTTPHSANPWSGHATAETVFVLGGGVVMFARDSGEYRSSFPTGAVGPLCGNDSRVWLLAANGTNWLAYDFLGNRAASQDVTLPNVGLVRDAYMAAGPDITPSAGALDFGIVQMGSPSPRSLTIQNRGASTLTLQSLGFPSPDVSSTNTFPVNLPSGGTVTLQVTYAPTGSGPITGAMILHSTDTMAPEFAISLSGTGAGSRFYVRQGNPAVGNGQSWATAFASLNAALASPLVLAHSEIWVQQGTYNLTTNLLVNRPLSLYGGFAGSETELSQRDWQSRPVVVDAGYSNLCFEILTNATVDGFMVQGGRPPSGYEPGGGFRVKGGDVLIANSTIRNNNARAQGSAMGTPDYGYDISSITVSNCVVTNNAGEYCTAIYSIARRVVVQDCVIRDNLPGTSTTRYNGGAIWCQQGETLTIQDTLISGHTGAAVGGGVAAYVTNLLVQNCEFTSNMATNTISLDRGGGALYVYSLSTTGSIQILNSTFSGNQATTAGAIQVDASGSSILIAGSVIQSNTATASWPGEAGGVHLNCGAVTIRDTLIAGNSAPVWGGGLYVSCPSIELDSVRLLGNRSGSEGGGARLLADNITLVNCLIADNTAGGKGAGLFISQQNYNGIHLNACTLVNNTITDTSLGAGLYIQQGSPLSFYNGIAWGNRDGGSFRNGLQISSASMTTVESSDVEDSWWGTRPTCTNSNPLFVDADGPDNNAATWQDNDYRLAPGSPCMDTADSLDPRAPGADLDGLFRPLDGDGNGVSTHDMGCYEFKNPDADGDGMDDGWETAHSVDDPDDDPDGDGHTNYEEFTADTNPHEPDALALAPTSLNPATGEATLNWQSSSACLYTIQTSTNLNQSWQDLAGSVSVSGSGGVMNVTVPVPVSTTTFVRIRIQRAP